MDVSQGPVSLRAFSLCLLTDIIGQDLFRYLDWLRGPIEGGVTSIQFRCKSLSSNEALRWAQALQAMLSSLSVPLIINDDVALAHQVAAAGVHLGQTDGCPIEARAVLGQQAIIGVSIESTDQLAAANKLDCIDYVAASAVFASPSKHNLRTIWGLDGLVQLTAASRHPVVAIGGIGVDNVRSVMDCGAAGVAVISAIHRATCPKSVAQTMLATVVER